ncbi:Nardilysin [Varanus komodoensis]|nr:Nardilysin [Varanus komodoensis]
MSGETKPPGTGNCPVIHPRQQRGQRCRRHRAQEDVEDRRKHRPKKNVGDPDIVKSPSDHKEYRYLKLKNGLNVLLISDLSYDDCNSSEASEEEIEEDRMSSGTDEEEIPEPEKNSSSEDEELKDGIVEEFADDFGGGDVSDETVEDDDKEVVSDRDPVRDFVHALKDNVSQTKYHDDPEGYEELVKQEVLNKMGSTEKQSAAALAVCIGSFYDPDDLPGLAHFLEHMVFMGSKKYPDENGFDTFLKKHGGSDNASTDAERTVFQFDIQKKYFKEALDRWAQFFIHPLMIKDAIDREVEAVDSGNAETLKHIPKKKNIDTYARLRDFWKRYYSAHYMNLVLQSRVIPVKEIHSFCISWALPPQEKNYRIKPLHYISWLIGHEGKGSVLSLLRKKFWALALYGGNGETGFEQNSTYSIFSISVTLTDEGLEHFYEVAYLIFQYLKMLQKNGPEKRIWEEIQKIEANEFCFQEQIDPLEYVENICENMHIFRKEDLLTGDQLLTEYNPEVIANALSYLIPQKANLFLLSPTHRGKCHLKEKWFGSLYSVSEIDASWSKLWSSDFALHPDLHLPEENKYIATDFTVKNSSGKTKEYPTKILNTSHGCLWYKEDNKFGVPKAFICFYLVSPLIQKSALNMVLFDTFVSILSHSLAEPAYEADVAQMEYKVIAKDHGLTIRVKGFNHKLPLLFELIIDHLSDLSFTPSTFQMIIEQLKKTYFNYLIKTDTLAKKLDFSPLIHPCPIQFRVTELPNTHILCKVKSLHKGDPNSEVTVYHQTGAKTLRDYSLTELLVMHMEEPCFDFLRTKNTLGTEFVDKKIEEFFLYFENKLRNLSEEEFTAQVSALIKLKQTNDSHLGEEVERNWNEVITQQYLFDRLAREVVGYGKQEGDLEVPQTSTAQDSLFAKIPELTFLSSSVLNFPTIMDIQAFTSTLNILPYHKILK